MEPAVVRVYTDGACLRNPGPGGWAALIDQDGHRRPLSGREAATTSNRMELTAAIRGLEATSRDAQVTLYSDSEYLVKSMTRGWKRNANQDLWAKLDELVAARKVRWEWVKGHAGYPENELVDALAGYEAGTRQQRPRLEDYLPASAQEGYAPSALTHLDPQGQARMVDVSAKAVTRREAVARASVAMRPETLALLQSGKLEKGDAFAVARVAGIMAAKETARLIPLCHPLPLEQVTVDFELEPEQGLVHITAAARTSAKTGVEMEAMTAAAVTALALYDMCKAAERGIRIRELRLVRKRGGKSGDVELE